MPPRLVTVAETPLFVRQAEDVWSDAEREAFVLFIAANPERGDLIPETGGVRKIRWGGAGAGKRGGTRVIYFYHDAERPLYLLMVYAKARQEDLTADEKREVRKLAATLKASSSKKESEDATMGKFGSELIESMKQAVAHAGGRKPPRMRVTKVAMSDVKAIRESLDMSQHNFAAAYRIPLSTLKNWEQGRRYPDAPAAAYLLAIRRRPKEVMEAVAERPPSPRTEKHFVDRAARAAIPKAIAILKRAGVGNPPMKGDRPRRATKRA